MKKVISIDLDPKEDGRLFAALDIYYQARTRTDQDEYEVKGAYDHIRAMVNKMLTEAYEFGRQDADFEEDR